MASSYRFGPPRGGGRFGGSQMQFGGLVPFAIKWLLITNGVLFVVHFLSTRFGFTPLLALFRSLSLIPDWVLHGALWQPVTYLFLHSPYEFGHILMNMFMMWMFGADLERDWGTRKFLRFYFFCGIGAGLVDVLFRAIAGDMATATIGNSGAVYGILLAFGYLYPDRNIYFWMLFPIPARIFVLILGTIAFLMTLSAPGGPVAHMAHLAGMVFAFIFLRSRRGFLDFDFIGAYRQWKLQRARKRFEVYMRKRDKSGEGRGPWVN